jgi:small nuclear ribonucleoprotein (snRNP)-like protein
MNTAPFTISFHDEASSWHDSPVLLALVGTTVVITTNDNKKFAGIIESINEANIIINNEDQAWEQAIIYFSDITDIYYC